MNPLDFLLKWIPPTWLLAATAVFAALAGIFFWLYQGKVDDYAQLQTQISLERQQAKDDAERAKERADRTTADVSLAWSAALDHLRSRPIRVLPGAKCGVPDANARPATGTDAGSSTANLRFDPTTITAAECEAALNSSIEYVVEYLWLQHWVREEQKALK